MTHKPILLASLLLSSTLAQAQWWNQIDIRRFNTLTPTSEEIAATPVETYNYQKLMHAADEVRRVAGNMARVERLMEDVTRGSGRATDGSWMVDAVRIGYERAFQSDENTIKSFLRFWAMQRPDSTFRPVAEAFLWQRRAWFARGNAYASQVPGEGMQIFRENLAKSTRALEAAGEAGKAYPMWYLTALIVAGSSGRPAAEFDALFEEAVARHPLYHPLYYTRMNYHLPQWGGSYEQVDDFITRSVARTAATEGTAFYTWLYLDIARKHSGDFFRDTAVSWPKMKKGFEDMLERYPDRFNRNVFATFACRARDKETTGRLLHDLGEAASLGAWSPGITTESCKRFALTPA